MFDELQCCMEVLRSVRIGFVAMYLTICIRTKTVQGSVANSLAVFLAILAIWGIYMRTDRLSIVFITIETICVLTH